jgi:Protein of unknown function (DUF4038)/Domain of unknown function (DUF5060)
METIRIAIVSVVLWCGFAMGVANSQVTVSAKKAEQWGIEQISLRSFRTYNNPFKDVQLAAEIVCNGQSMRVAGFYDGEQIWRIRFMPDQRGFCEFATHSNDAELNGKSGSFEVGPPSSGNHGPVRVAKTFHFSYADGTPYFLLGTTLYNWLNRDDSLQHETLDTLSKNPFTKVRFGLFPKWYRFNRVEPSTYPYVETSPQKFDLERFNPEFFRHVESRIEDLERLGIEADIILFHPYDHLGFATMDAEHDDAYIRYVCARLSAFRNVLWTMANEYDLFDPKMIPGQKVKDWDRMFRILEQSDPYQHPRGIHNIADWYDHSKPWITHVVIQDGTGHPGRRLAGARAKYGKPILVDEYGYEGNNGQNWGGISGAEELSRHWDITMEGAYASHGETYVHPGGVLWWAAGGTLVGESPSRLGFLKQIMTEGPFQDVVPSPEIVKGGTVLARKDDYYLLRVKQLAFNQHVEIQLGEGYYKVNWIDPWLMKIYELGYTQGGLQAFDPPMTPSLLRFVRVNEDPSKLGAGPVQTLIARFLNDRTMAHPPEAIAIQQRPAFYTIEYTIGELQDDPRTDALVEKYLTLPAVPFVRALTVEQLMPSPDRNNNIGDIYGFLRELTGTPVTPGSNQ